MILKNFIYVLKRFKTSSILNILGLSAAIFIFIIVVIQVKYDLTFNTTFNKHDDIFLLSKLQRTALKDEYSSAMQINEVNALVNSFSEIKNHCYVKTNNKELPVKILSNSSDIKDQHFVYCTFVSEDFKDIFQPSIIEGSLANVFSDPNSTMISQKTAKRLFGNQSPIGESVEIQTIVVTVEKGEGGTSIYASNEPKAYLIKAVYKDFPDNISFDNGFITYAKEQKYLTYNNVFFEINKNQIGTLKEKINQKNILDQFSFFNQSVDGKLNVEIEKDNLLTLLPIKNIHINYPTISSKATDKSSIYLLMLIGLFALIIAYINFVNFTTAMAPARVRGINIRMVVGADKNMTRFIIASEALFFTLLSFALALLYLLFFQGNSIAQIFSADIHILQNVGTISYIAIALLVISFLIGIYPALYITNFDPVIALKSIGNTSVRSVRLRNTLIVIQLLAAICFITIALFINQQHSYMINYSLGFDKNNILTLPLYEEGRKIGKDTNLDVFVQEIIKNPNIKEYSGSQPIMGEDRIHRTSSSTFQDGDDSKIYITSYLSSLNNFIEFFNIQIAEGEGFDTSSNNCKNESVVNEQFLTRHNITGGQEGLRKSKYLKDSSDEIIGIVKDFHYSSLLNEIQSVRMYCGEVKDMQVFYFKPMVGMEREVRTHIETIWSKFSENECPLQFLDQKLEQLYTTQENLAKVISIVSLIVIFIAVMGIYGLITFNTRYRTREIAIRKVSGAEINNILLLLNKDLLLLYVASCITAIPIIYFAVHIWLQQFPIHIPINWWIFLLGQVIILLIVLITVSWQSYQSATKNPVESLKSE